MVVRLHKACKRIIFLGSSFVLIDDLFNCYFFKDTQLRVALLIILAISVKARSP